jgi:hypothetical protein
VPRVVRLLMMGASIYASGMCFAGSLPDQPTVSIYALASIVPSGSSIDLQLKIVNGSSSSISFVEVPHTEGGSHFGVAYAIKLHTPNGEVKTFLGISHGSSKGVALKPGDALQEEILLSDKFDMTYPGEYTVEVSPFTPTGEGLEANFHSNTITLTVN